VDGPSVYAYAKNSPQMFVDPDGRFVPLVPIIIGGGIGLLIDYGISKLKESCGCESTGSTAGPAGNAAIGAGTGSFGKFASKPRGGIAGGGKSGGRTSPFSLGVQKALDGGRISIPTKNAMRRFGRGAARAFPGLGAALTLKDLAEAAQCLKQ